MPPTNIGSCIVRYINSGYKWAEKAILGSHEGYDTVQRGLGAQQKSVAGALPPTPGYEYFLMVNSPGGDADRLAGLGAQFPDFRIGKEVAALALDDRNVESKPLVYIERAGVGVEVEAPLCINPVFAEIALDFYAFLVAGRGTHDCSLADDPLLYGCPLLLAQKLLQIAELLNGRCLFSTQGKQLVKTVLDISNSPCYANSENCNSQDGPTGGQECGGFSSKTG